MSPLPTTARGTATSRRILDAAAQEFAERGIAGARIDRITATAQTNKAQVYGYFGSKDGLFDAVVADRVDRLTDAVTFDPADLAGFAVAMYDETLRHPELVRLATWLRLERHPAGRLVEGSDDEPKFQAIAAAQAAGHIRPGRPSEIFALVLAMAFAWSPAAGFYAATADEPAADHERRRTLLRESVERAVAPL